ncbi:D-alanyl-D-alanine carboxypeptidase/D-alanyl-D-alanine-endopeptidase [Nocardiopsis sp. CNT312]|uniref:D-alanyl-D-alanine carboxypeptidase/D-alanyl-D-alanine endopeptidase n=1 Tax=Nocardiopsis sp. CNT312 TaxID=1137268 RepID=UPI0004913F8A|nr:D-alanyl-D-alanine carboxypeptidase/D-alanyl-D-alanine-endopeptidase [Nocardiopsis sp. CNT312]
MTTAVPRGPRPGAGRAFACRPRLAAAALAVLPLAVLAPAPSAFADSLDERQALADLRTDIDALLADPSLTGAVSGVVVADPETGERLYERDGGEPLVPASAMKLFTTAAALELLGTDHTFTTEAVADRRGRSRSVGDVYLVGGGDPALTVDDLDAMAAEVAASGVRGVRGDVVADDTWFDDERLVDDWWPSDEPYAYSAQISALTVAHGERLDTGVTEVVVTPAAEGEPVRVDLGAAEGYMELDNSAVTVAAGGSGSVVVDRPTGTNTITVTGTLPEGAAPVVRLRTVDEPAVFTAHLFRRALERHGVTVRGDVSPGRAPERHRRIDVLADHESEELGELLPALLKFSNNGHAEMLVKTLGRETSGEGSWSSGGAAVERAVSGLGVDTSGLVFHDGSGLSRTDRITAVSLTELLDHSREASWYGTWSEALPLAGDPDPWVGGTLAGRMGGTAADGVVRAKTGTMTGVSVLSGYVTGPDGDQRVFAIVNNGHTGRVPWPVQDAIAVRLAEYLGHEAVIALRAERAPGPRGSRELECSWELTC